MGHAGELMDKRNGYIEYLNSMHNIASSGANALAESQALSPYFGEVYTSFPIVHSLVEALTAEVQRVVILTGHAGDGKSTIALDVLKKLRNLPLEDPLDEALNKQEDVEGPHGPISIIKDMSELSADERREWLELAFSGSGSWLFISNTGPLLNSLVDYAQSRGAGGDTESEILKRMDLQFVEGDLEKHSLAGFDKEIQILNLTRLNNLELGAQILTKLVNHSAWNDCTGCSAEMGCPIQLNRKAVRDAGPVAEMRVRWIYQRLQAYEKRLTLRQIVAQLAFGLTGNMSCEGAFQHVTTSTMEGIDKGTEGLEKILFSEGFFGYRGGVSSPEASELHAVSLVQRVTFGAPVSVEFERSLASEAGMGWSELPSSLSCLENNWRERANASESVRWRAALRRMTYLFGDEEQKEMEPANIFLDAFLQSPSLREFDLWRASGKLTLTRAGENQLRKSCLRVLLEYYSGFSASQFDPNHERLFLTLRRSDQVVVQPTQLVIEALSFRDFKLSYDPVRSVPVLSFGGDKANLELSLPLLDFIRRRDAGELGSNLSPIHQAKLDWFRGQLIDAASDTGHHAEEIELLRSGIDGEVALHRFLLDEEQNLLEQG
jgi:hypothetical protein